MLLSCSSRLLMGQGTLICLGHKGQLMSLSRKDNPACTSNRKDKPDTHIQWTASSQLQAVAQQQRKVILR
jgi:hypothetical protein